MFIFCFPLGRVTFKDEPLHSSWKTPSEWGRMEKGFRYLSQSTSCETGWRLESWPA